MESQNNGVPLVSTMSLQRTRMPWHLRMELEHCPACGNSMAEYGCEAVEPAEAEG